MTALIERRVTLAYVNWGRWVANCPGLYCRSALGVDPGEQVFRCLDCHTEAVVRWPANGADIAYLLAMRPDPATRNWLPDETLHDLLAENLLHGIALPEVDGVHHGGRLVIVGDRITEGAALPAHAHLMIGA